ncbi:MAG: hypothetical protein QNJ43_09830 [Breoghania sp.]|nr:hypothetical protein [Breoghania sp.]
MAEACLKRSAHDGSLRAFSAAVHPASRLNPALEQLLRGRGHANDALQPKSWEVFALPHAPAPDLLIGLGVCLPSAEPDWTAQPERWHWHLDIGSPRAASPDIPALYQAIETAVGDFLLGRDDVHLPRAG